MPKDFRVATNPATMRKFTKITRADLLREIDESIRDIRVASSSIDPDSSAGILLARTIKRLVRIHHLGTMGN